MIETLIPKQVLIVFLALATLGLWAQHIEVQRQRSKNTALELTIKTIEADAATRAAKASESFRAIEHSWSATHVENSNDASIAVSQVRVAASRGAVSGAGLRVRLAEAAARCGGTAEDPASPAGSASAASAGLLLADVSGRLEQAGRLLAEEADLRRIRGLTCERDYPVNP